MTGFLPFRSLGSVMVVTLHVAVMAYMVRSFLRPTSLTGSFAVWVPLSILAALFLTIPIGQAIASAFHPEDGLNIRQCPRCGRGELRPLLRTGSGLFSPISGYRCASCRTTFRQVDESVVEEAALDLVAPAEPDGIDFLTPGPGELAGESEIRFLDDPGGSSAGDPGRTNILPRTVSGS